MLRFASFLMAAGVVLGGCAARPVADLVLLGGKIVTLDPAHPEVSALAARAGKIVALGTDGDIKRYLGKDTAVVELNGRLAVPGFIEAHGHIRNLGEQRLSVDLTRTHSWDEIVAKVHDAAAAAKPGSWIFGRGWHQEKWDRAPSPIVEGYPVQDALNDAAPNNPVVLRHASGHGSIANAAALREAGIDRTTKNPAGGRIVRDARGDPPRGLLENPQAL